MNEPNHTLFQQMRQRRLFQVLIVYLGLAFGLVEVSQFVVENYDLSRKVLDVTLFLLILGIPAVVVIAWFHGERGHQSVHRSEAAILVVLLMMAGIGTYRIGTAESLPDRDLSAVVDLGDHSVAVIPFSSTLTDPEMEWLSTGVSELLTTGLAGLASIRVVSGQRLFDLLRQEGREDATVIPADLATRLTRRAGARFMVDGSILGSRDDLVMTADLVNVETGDVEASSRVRGADVFALVDQIAADLSEQIAGASIEPTEMAPVASFTTRNPEAYRQYLLAVQAERRFHRSEATQHYQNAVALDSTFALAHIRLSGVALNNGEVSVGVQALQDAKTFRHQAPERDRLFLDAMLAQTINQNADEARQILTDLVARYPDDKEIRAALLQQYGARSQERGHLLEATLLLDPLDGNAYNELAYFRARQGDFMAADSLIQRYVDLQPNEPNPLDSRGEILMMAGRHEEARVAFRAALALRPDFNFSSTHLAESWSAEGLYEDGAVEIEQFIARSDDIPALNGLNALAILRLNQGDLSAAVAALQSAATRARELGEVGIANRSLLSQVPVLIAQQDWPRLGDRSRILYETDPLNPFPPLAMLLAAAEQGDLAGAEALAAQMRAALDSVPGLSNFRPLIEASLNTEISFYRGDYLASVTNAALRREAGGFPELGSYAEVRSLIELEQFDEAVVRATRMGTFDGVADVLLRKHRLYYLGRAYEGLGDTAKAIDNYQALLTGDWPEAVKQIPNLADAPERLAALRSG